MRRGVVLQGEAGQAAAPASGASKLHTELDLIVQSRPGPSVAVLNLHPADPCVHPQEDPRRLVRSPSNLQSHPCALVPHSAASPDRMVGAWIDFPKPS